MNITSQWPWLLTQGHQFQQGLSKCNKQTFSENCAQIGTFVRLEFVHWQTQEWWNRNFAISKPILMKFYYNQSDFQCFKYEAPRWTWSIWPWPFVKVTVNRVINPRSIIFLEKCVITIIKQYLNLKSIRVQGAKMQRVEE